MIEMRAAQLKSSVVIDPYESKRNLYKEDCRSNISTVGRSEASSRKLKVSETITPVMSDIDRFSLRIKTDNSASNRSYGSLNESFEKNIKLNLQNSFATSYSSDSRNKKVSVSAAPLIKSIIPLINPEVDVIKDTQTLMEVDNEDDECNEDIDDVDLSSCNEEKNDSKLLTGCNVQISKELYPEDSVIAIEENNFDMEILKSEEEVHSQSSVVSGRQAKVNAKEKIVIHCKIFNEFAQPVDIDESQLFNQIPVTVQSEIEHTPIIEKRSFISDTTTCQQSKLCDVSKAYILSQESSLISSPLEQDTLQSALNLPGRPSCVQFNIQHDKSPGFAKPTNISKSKMEDPIKRPPFFKSSFRERRRLELEKFNDSIDIVSKTESPVSKLRKRQPKAKPLPKPKKSKEKKEKKIQKKTKRKVKDKKISKLDDMCTIDSTKDQMKNIIIEDSDNDKFNEPIEQIRGNPNGSDDDLFSFTPEMAPKPKRKITKKVAPISKRKSSFSTVYDINSEMSSPSPVKLSYTSLKSNNEGSPSRLGDEIISRRSWQNIVSGFESDLEQLKTLHQSLSYQLNQFKEMTKYRHSFSS